MNYLKIKLKNNKSVLVDESAEIPVEAKYITQEENPRRYVIYTKSITGTLGYKPMLITATINYSIDKDVPMVFVEDEVETLTTDKYTASEIIKSLNKEYIELETEQYTQNLHKDVWYDRIKTDRVDGQLIAYVKQQELKHS